MGSPVLKHDVQETADLDPGAPSRRVCELCCAVYRTAFTRCPLDGGHLVYRSDDPLIGSTLGGRYVILECVGEGAMGRVYRARHNRVSRMFAVKILFGDLAANEQMRARFAREAEAASRLSHPNVVSVIDFGETEAGLLYIAMDFIEGQTLGRLVRDKGRLDEPVVRRLGIEILHGLAHAHERGLVHRDLKPENIIVVKQGARDIPKIVDFGVAFLNEGERVEERNARLTQSGCIVGTPSFMAPEQALGEAVGPTADLFSFGVCLYYALAGRAPFEGEAFTVLQRLMCDPMPRVEDRAPEATVSSGMQSVLDRLTERAVGDRFQTCQEAIDAIENLDAGPILPARGPGPASTATRRAVQRGPAPMVIVFAAVSLLGFGVAGFVSMTSAQTALVELVGLDEDEARSLGVPPSMAEVPPEPIEVGVRDTELDALEGADEPATLTIDSEGVPPSEPAPESNEPAKKTPRVADRPKATREAASAPREAAPPRPPSPAEDVTPPIEAKVRPAKRTTSGPAAPAPGAEDPIPPVSELRTRYLAVGEALQALGAARGAAVAEPLRARYFKIPYATAQRIPSVRRDVVEALVQLERDIAAKR